MFSSSFTVIEWAYSTIMSSYKGHKIDMSVGTITKRVLVL